MIQLSKRLETIFDMTSWAHLVCDVGCDHGHLSIALLQSGKAEYVIASDIGEGPLSSAGSNMSGLGLDGRFELVRSDGLSHLDTARQPDAVIIAGMGGFVMQQILSAGIEVARGCRELILSPQSNITEFRGFLSDEGFEILDERMVFEDGKYYTIEKVRYDTGLYQELTDIQKAMGPVLLEKRDPVFLEYLESSRDQILSFIGDVPKARADELQAYLDMIGEVID